MIMNKCSAILAHNLLEALTTTKRYIPDELLRGVLGEDSWRLLQQKIDLVQQHSYAQRPVISAVITNAFQLYSETLAKADELDNRAEHTKAMVMPSAKTKMRLLTTGQPCSRSSNSRNILRRRAEKAYERALEILEELLGESPDLVNYLDRPVCFNCENCNVWPDIESVPRLINSRSPHNKCRPPRKLVRNLKIEAVRSRLELLGLGFEHGH